MDKFRHFIRSPLFRQPRLLAGKLMHRAGVEKPFTFADPPGGLRWQTDPAWTSALRIWIDHCGPDREDWTWTRVFHQDFGEASLLRMCREGPDRSAGIHGDIKLPWEFSRLHGLFLAEVTGGAEREQSAGRLRKWTEANSDPAGINWTNAMEVGIRAVNLIAADALSDGRLRASFGEAEWLGLMWNHARAIEARIEARIISSNHYIADLLGLLIIGAHLRGSGKAAAWLRFAGDEIQSAVISQSRRDGGVYEASLPYHALVTEMALLAASLPAVDIQPAFRNRLTRMCRVLADMMDHRGDVFQIGDDDGGRILPLDFISSTHGRAEVLLELAGQLGLHAAADHPMALYPESGWARIEYGSWTGAVEFGGVGFLGRGGHAHNDTLSLCLNLAGRPLLIDPGSYLYSPDPEARNRFRGTAWHSTFTLDGREHHTDGRELFLLPGPDDAARILFKNRHALTLRFALPGSALHLVRAVRFMDDHVEISDWFEGAGKHEIHWYFHFAPGLSLDIDAGMVRIRDDAGPAALLTAPAGVDLETLPGETAPYYGSRTSTVRLHGRVHARAKDMFTWKMQRTPQT